MANVINVLNISPFEFTRENCQPLKFVSSICQYFKRSVQYEIVLNNPCLYKNQARHSYPHKSVSCCQFPNINFPTCEHAACVEHTSN